MLKTVLGTVGPVLLNREDKGMTSQRSEKTSQTTIRIYLLSETSDSPNEASRGLYSRVTIYVLKEPL
jgi:hypothetical protein